MDRKRDQFELIEGTTALTAGPRYGGQVHGPGCDTVVLQVFQRTMGPSSGRGVLLSRQAVEDLVAWGQRWLAEGWDGQPRACGRVHKDSEGRQWECDQEPGHLDDHDGPSTGWRSADPGKPGRESWPRPEAERRALYAAEFGQPFGSFLAARRGDSDAGS